MCIFWYSPSEAPSEVDPNAAWSEMTRVTCSTPVNTANVCLRFASYSCTTTSTNKAFRSAVFEIYLYVPFANAIVFGITETRSFNRAITRLLQDQ